MKFYSQDPVFFLDVSEDLRDTYENVKVGHLNFVSQIAPSDRKDWIIVEDSLEAKNLVSELYQNNLSHFVQKNQNSFTQDLSMSGDLLEQPEHYFQSEYQFCPVENSESLKIVFSSQQDKAEIFKQATEFIEKIRSTPAKEAALATIEELYMNAVFDAPKESGKMGLTLPLEPCEFYLFKATDTLQISCTDSFGSLDLQKLFTRMNNVYQHGPGNTINLHGIGGAGIGCFLLLEKCRALIFGVKRGIKTKVTCLIPLAASNRERDKIKKSLHGFEVVS